MDYLGYARKNLHDAASYLTEAPASTPTEQVQAAALEEERPAALNALEQMTHTLASDPALMRAVDFVFLGLP